MGGNYYSFSKVGSLTLQKSTNYRHKKENLKQYRVNNGIRSKEVRVIIGRGDSESKLLDVKDAIKLAEEQGLDLVEVAPNQYPPVCRILDYGKFRFIQSKKAKEAKKSQSKILMKDVRLRMRIGEHDMKSKENKIRTFISSGYKVRVSVFFRGREMAYPDIAINLLKKLANQVEDISIVDKVPSIEGRSLSIILAPMGKVKG